MFEKRKRTRAQLEQEFQNLDFTSDFLFSELMKEEQLCIDLIQTLLKIRIEKVIHHKTQKIFSHGKHIHGVRFDVYLKDSSRVFDIEMQVKHYENLPLRARYYQSNIDLDCLKKKQDYKFLPESYVVFICTRDPFGLGLPVYTVRNFVEEKLDFRYNDKSSRIFFNASAWKNCEDAEVKAFLRYLSTRKVSSEFTGGIAGRIEKAHRSIKLKDHFMTLRMKLREEREDGRLEGFAQGAHDKAVETAKILLANNIDLSLIVKSTGLSIEQIKEITE